MKALIAIALGFATLCHISHRALMAVPMQQGPRGKADTLASTDALRLLTLGYGSLGADYYWLRAISHFGDKRMHRYLYPDLQPLLDRVVALDPKFASAYVMAGQALSFAGMDPAVPMNMLEQGMRERPDSWRIPFVLGFDAYYLKNDYAMAARYLARAADLPGCPEYVGPFATRLAAESGEPEIGLQFIDAMLHSETDPALIASYQKRRLLLLLEVDLKSLNKAVESFTQTHPQGPADLEDLVRANVIPGVPQDPLGGTFFIGPDKRVHTHHEAQRMKLSQAAKHAPARTEGHAKP